MTASLGCNFGEIVDIDCLLPEGHDSEVSFQARIKKYQYWCHCLTFRNQSRLLLVPAKSYGPPQQKASAVLFAACCGKLQSPPFLCAPGSPLGLSLPRSKPQQSFPFCRLEAWNWCPWPNLWAIKARGEGNESILFAYLVLLLHIVAFYSKSKSLATQTLPFKSLKGK